MKYCYYEEGLSCQVHVFPPGKRICNCGAVDETASNPFTLDKKPFHRHNSRRYKKHIEKEEDPEE